MTSGGYSAVRDL